MVHRFLLQPCSNTQLYLSSSSQLCKFLKSKTLIIVLYLSIKVIISYFKCTSKALIKKYFKFTSPNSNNQNVEIVRSNAVIQFKSLISSRTCVTFQVIIVISYIYSKQKNFNFFYLLKLNHLIYIFQSLQCIGWCNDIMANSDKATSLETQFPSCKCFCFYHASLSYCQDWSHGQWGILVS